MKYFIVFYSKIDNVLVTSKSILQSNYIFETFKRSITNIFTALSQILKNIIYNSVYQRQQK